MSHAAEQITKAEQEAALRDLAIWSAGNTLKDALKTGDVHAQSILIELEQVKKDRK